MILSVIKFECEVDFFGSGSRAYFLTDFQRGQFLVPYFENAAQFILVVGSLGQSCTTLRIWLHKVDGQRCGNTHHFIIRILQRIGFVLAARGYHPYKSDNPKVKMILFHVLSILIFNLLVIHSLYQCNRPSRSTSMSPSNPGSMSTPPCISLVRKWARTVVRCPRL